MGGENSITATGDYWVTDDNRLADAWRSGSRTVGIGEERLRRAYREGGMTMTAMAAELGLSVSRVSRLIAAAERGEARGETL